MSMYQGVLEERERRKDNFESKFLEGQIPTYLSYKAETDQWIFHLDNHLCATFDSCERRFYYRHVEHISPKGLPGFKMQVGSWWSLVMKEYYELFTEAQRMGSSWSHNDCKHIMEIAARKWLELKMEQYKDGNPYEQKQYEEFGGYTGAMRMAQTYHLTWSELDARTLRVIGAESGFGLKNEVLIGETNRVVVYLTGIPDLVVLENGKNLEPLDHKSKDYIEPKVLEEYKPDHQLAGYCFAVKALARQCGYNYDVEYAIVNLCGRLEPKKPKDPAKQPTPRYRRLTIYFSDAELEEWRLGRVRIAERMRDAFEEGTFAQTDDRIQCHSVFMKQCSFRGICKLPPEHRSKKIQSDYVQVEPWEPYKLAAKVEE